MTIFEPVFGEINENVMAENEEKEVKYMKPELSPPEQVQQVVECLQASPNMLHNATKLGFQRWTIMDYSRAYQLGEVTPRVVRHSHS